MLVNNLFSRRLSFEQMPAAGGRDRARSPWLGLAGGGTFSASELALSSDVQLVSLAEEEVARRPQIWSTTEYYS
jgi:hypothetical protein